MKKFNLIFIQERRKELDLTLQEVATAMNIKNASTYLKYETGAYSLKAEQLPLLATVLKCEPANFFTQ